MTSFLSKRAKFAVLVGSSGAVATAFILLMRREWAAAALFAVVAALWVSVAITWGIASAVLVALEKARKRERRKQKGFGGVVANDLAGMAPRELGGAAGPNSPPGARSLEQRYHGLQHQPYSRPTNQLLALLELLARDATTRRADEAVLQEALAEIRDELRLQAGTLQGLVSRIESMPLEDRGAPTQAHS